MTDHELKALIASLAVSQKETDRLLTKTIEEDKERQKKAEERQKKAEERAKALDKQIKELGKQIGGLGRKFGSFTEGLALPSMEKILQKQFKMEVISPSVRIHKEGEDMEIDVLAYANSTINEVYIVEVKSHVREESIRQLQKMIQNFERFFPEHKDKKVFGILAAVDIPATLRKRILDLGFYTARIKEDIFSLDVPKGFKAKAY